MQLCLWHAKDTPVRPCIPNLGSALARRRDWQTLATPISQTANYEANHAQPDVTQVQIACNVLQIRMVMIGYGKIRYVTLGFDVDSYWG